jgi:hypothetical protein
MWLSGWMFRMRCRRFDTYAGWQWRNSDYEIATQGDWSGCLVDHLKKVGKSIRSAKDSYVRPLCSGWRKMLDACIGNRASAQSHTLRPRLVSKSSRTAGAEPVFAGERLAPTLSFDVEYGFGFMAATQLGRLNSPSWYNYEH